MNWTQYPTHRAISRAQRAAWAKQILTRDPVCKRQGPRCTHTATEADHILNVQEGGNELDPTNGQGLCHNCHNDKTQEEARRGQNRWKRKPEPHPGLK